MAGLITVADLVARPGFEGLDSTQAEALITDASALVRDVVAPDLDDVEAPDTPPGVVPVIVNMVRRGLSNPHGHTQASLGDHSYSAGSVTLYLTDDEEELVRRALAKAGFVAVPMSNFELPETSS